MESYQQNGCLRSLEDVFQGSLHCVTGKQMKTLWLFFFHRPHDSHIRPQGNQIRRRGRPSVAALAGTTLSTAAPEIPRTAAIYKP